MRTTLRDVRNGSIVRLHFGYAGTVTAMPKLLAGLRDRGLRPVTVSELLAGARVWWPGGTSRCWC